MARIKPGSRRRLCLALEHWPEADRAAWQQATQDADPFNSSSAASSWAERMRAKTTAGYGRWLCWLSEQGADMNQLPADRVTRQRVEAYIVDLRRINSDFTILFRLEELYSAIRVMAPDYDWGWLRRVQNALRSRGVAVRNKATRIQPAGALVELGKMLMCQAETPVTKPLLKRAVLFRDGLMIAFLAYRPLRLSNFAMIALGRHLIPQSSGYRLYFSGPEVKGRKPIETAVPASLVGDFDRYLDHHRPILLSRGGRQHPSAHESLWVSEIGTPLHPPCITERIKKHTQAAFGRHLWVHLFRDCAATTIAIEDPRHVRSIKNILGHSKLTTSEKHYNQARSLEASRRYQQILADWLQSFDQSGARDT
jgi:site-specific recombinase XerC